ncbi:MAG: class I mannose-6-phosphate isomerase [Erythrobacter sp.]|nr:class I mannose-6-phosphate isomerase [Erythrobacter sp.]
MILPTRIVEKPWGRDALPAPFVAPAGMRVGEIWFEPPPELPGLLVKYLFTSEKLSVQVHPGGADGKEECWVVVAAEPGATLGIGFDAPLSAEAMRAAAQDGSIEDLLTWHAVQPGDFFYIPAGTVHAIGPGCTLVEVQQNCDVTWRLYDYGRPRELHLDHGVAVASGEPYALGEHMRRITGGHQTLADGPAFRLDLVDGVPDAGLLYSYAAPLLVLPLAGEVLAGSEVVRPGECACAPDMASVTFAPEGRALVAAPV